MHNISRDPVYKLPFKYGWKRELVYHSSKTNQSSNASLKCDVFYYSPNNKKCCTLQEVEEELALTQYIPLLVQSFTFIAKSLVVNDESKEIIRKPEVTVFQKHSNLEIANEKKVSEKITIDDSKYKLPFEHGWTREVVYRSKPTPKRKFDVYYYSPDNKKFRSLKSVKEELGLNKSNILQYNNFIFSLESIGINDDSKEISRKAHVSFFKGSTSQENNVSL